MLHSEIVQPLISSPETAEVLFALILRVQRI
jgi:hypothetical protein